MPESKSKRKRKTRGRPTPPKTPARRRHTARWVPIVFFTCMGAGVLVIILNYMQVFGTFRNYLLFVGLGLMGAAFAVSTRWY